MSAASLLVFATAMFTVLNPIGNTALFAGMVADRSTEERRKIAVTSTLAVAVILVVTIWIGQQVLAFFGVSTASLETAGGLVIAFIGMSMLHSQQSEIHHPGKGATDPGSKESIAIVPLAMPIVAGPGAIATAIVSSHKHPGVQSSVEMSLVAIVISLVIGACFLAVGPITRVLGTAGISIVTKFMGLILLAVAMGMLANGLKGLLPGLAG